MRKTQQFALLLFSAILLTGCGVEQYAEIHVSDKTLNSTGKVYLTLLEKGEFDFFKNTPAGQALQGRLANVTWEQELKNGTPYFTATQHYSLSGDELNRNLILDNDKFIMYSNFDKHNNGISSSVVINDILKNQSPEFFRFVFSFDKDVLDTNGTLEDTRQVVFSSIEEMETNLIYACFTKKAADCDTVTADCDRYTKNKHLSFHTDGVITEITVDGEPYVPYVYCSAEQSGTSSVIYRDYYDFNEEKTYKFTVTLSSGIQKKFTFTYDTTAPKIKYKQHKIYVSDKTGVKKITLNGKTISNKKAVKKKGTYKVKAWDKAGNITEYRFKVK